MTVQQACDRVTKGAAHLDQVKPGWAERIDVGTLTLHDPCGCIVGQLIRGTTHGESFSCSLIALQVLPPNFYTDDDETYTHFVAGYGFDLSLEEHMCMNLREVRASYSVLQEAWIAAIADRLMPTSEEGTPDPARFTPVNKGEAIGSALHSSSAGSPR